MKKLFKRIAVLICIVTLFAAPAYYASAAAPTPTLIFDDGKAKFLYYQPNPYSIPVNTGDYLHDITTSSGKWEVPAGKSFQFYCNLSGPGQVTMIIVFDKNNNQVYNDVYATTAAFPSHEFFIPPTTQDQSYSVLVAAVSNISVTGYMGIIQ